VKTAREAVMCEEARANAVGFVSIENRKRNISLETIKNIVSELRSSMKTVIIGFPDTAEEIIEKAAITNVNAVEIFTLDSEEIEKIKQQGFEVIRAVTIDLETKQSEIPVNELIALTEASDVMLFEASMQGKKGGLGLEYDYEKTLAPFIKHCKKFAIAGGLTPFNLEKALALKPYSVNVSSGVESENGEKDLNIIKEFVERCNQ